MGELQLKNLTIRYGGTAVVRNFNLEIRNGQMVSLLGPSGAGKTTVLKAVAGLIHPQEGEILIDGQPVTDRPPEKRNTVMVFQKSLLFPFMNVDQNIAFGLRMQGRQGSEIHQKIHEIMQLMELTGLGKRKVRELIQDIQAETGITTLFVTHDQSEALMISHRVGLILDGRLRQVGEPRELFYRPADPEVARFFGGCNFIQGRIKNGSFHSEFATVPTALTNGNGHLLTATIRPEDIIITSESKYDLQGQVQKTNFEGSATRIWVQCKGNRFAVLTSDADFSPGQNVGLHLPLEKIRIFPARS